MLVFFQIFFITARSSSLACSRFPGFKKQEGKTSLASFTQQSLSVLTMAAALPAETGWVRGPRMGLPSHQALPSQGQTHFLYSAHS